MPMDSIEPTLFELDHGGEGRDWLPPFEGEEKAISDLLPGESLRREPLNFPDVSEPEVVRHFTRLSRRNFCIDSGFYPLGSCTMKYNPKINDALAALPGFTQLHPEAGMEASQGTLRILGEMQNCLAALTGLPG
ncbi:MAG: aminomethyl-transferring glycine dehydrogenase subunit GcvPB, partial [Candidatus Hinthialibacter sp.]